VRIFPLWSRHEFFFRKDNFNAIDDETNSNYKKNIFFCKINWKTLKAKFTNNLTFDIDIKHFVRIL